MKSYTNLEQSKKLAEFLPLESADMKFPYFGNGQYGETARVGELIEFSGGKDISCWSLAALLNVLPISIDEGQHCLSLINSNPNDIDWLCCYEDYKGDLMMECYADNPIDACVEMIYQLKERDLI